MLVDQGLHPQLLRLSLLKFFERALKLLLLRLIRFASMAALVKPLHQELTGLVLSSDQPVQVVRIQLQVGLQAVGAGLQDEQ